MKGFSTRFLTIHRCVHQFYILRKTKRKRHIPCLRVYNIYQKDKEDRNLCSVNMYIPKINISIPGTKPWHNKTEKIQLIVDHI